MSPANTREEVLEAAANLRWEVGPDLHDSLMEALYTDAARISDRVLSRDEARSAFDLDRTIDRLVTSRWLGFPIMML
ncbi:MAG: ferrous iron transporter B, partial [Acidobacteria bacterium]|nr:ferrous iron transporter B [Acidobacteriota bacterium]